MINVTAIILFLTWLLRNGCPIYPVLVMKRLKKLRIPDLHLEASVRSAAPLAKLRQRYKGVETQFEVALLGKKRALWRWIGQTRSRVASRSSIRRRVDKQTKSRRRTHSRRISILPDRNPPLGDRFVEQWRTFRARNYSLFLPLCFTLYSALRSRCTSNYTRQRFVQRSSQISFLSAKKSQTHFLRDYRQTRSSSVFSRRGHRNSGSFLPRRLRGVNAYFSWGNRPHGAVINRSYVEKRGEPSIPDHRAICFAVVYERWAKAAAEPDRIRAGTVRWISMHSLE